LPRLALVERLQNHAVGAGSPNNRNEQTVFIWDIRDTHASQTGVDAPGLHLPMLRLSGHANKKERHKQENEFAWDVPWLWNVGRLRITLPSKARGHRYPENEAHCQRSQASGLPRKRKPASKRRPKVLEKDCEERIDAEIQTQRSQAVQRSGNIHGGPNGLFLHKLHSPTNAINMEPSPSVEFTFYFSEDLDSAARFTRILPPFITKATRRTAVMSLSGLPSRAMMSASRPGAIEPARS